MLPGPLPEVRSEHREVVRGRRSHRARGDGRGHRVVDVQPPPLRLQRPPQPLLAPPGVGADVRRHVHLVGVGLGGHLAHLVDDVAGPEHQPAAPLAQARVEVPQTVGEERQPVRHREADVHHTPVAHEQGNHLSGLGGGAQRGLVVQAQVGGEQDDRDVHGARSGRRGKGVVQCFPPTRPADAAVTRRAYTLPAPSGRRRTSHVDVDRGQENRYDGPGGEPKNDAGGVCGHGREGVEAVFGGAPRGSWPAEEFAARRRDEGEPAKVVMDLKSDAFLVVVPVGDED